MLNSLEFYSTKFGLYPRGDRSWGDFQSERLPPGPTLTRQEMFSACLLYVKPQPSKTGTALCAPFTCLPHSAACHHRRGRSGWSQGADRSGALQETGR